MNGLILSLIHKTVWSFHQVSTIITKKKYYINIESDII